MGGERARAPGKISAYGGDGNTQAGHGDGLTSTTLDDLFARWTQGVADARSSAAQAAVHVHQARSTIAKLSAKPESAEARSLRAVLRWQVGLATSAMAATREDGRSAGAAIGQLLHEARPHLDASSADIESSSDALDSDPATIARRGVAGPGQRLPHLDIVQRAFGSHDLSGVRAHIGGAAADASRALGAHAYAHGNDIAFAEDPTAAMVAHEATHIVQQRAGVSLKGIDGGASDAHEQQAEAVEQRVAQGKSAEDLISAIRGGGGGASQLVQRKSGPSAGTAPASPLSGPFDVADDGMSARVRSAWVGDDAARWLEVLHAMQAKGAVPWAADAALQRLARILVERNRHTVAVIPFRLDATAIAIVGLPPGAKPLVEAYRDGLQIAIEGLSGPQFDTELDLAETLHPGTPSALAIPNPLAPLFRDVYAALERFTGLRAIQRPVLHPRAAGPTTALLRLSGEELVAIFGAEAWQAYVARTSRKGAKEPAAPSGSAASAKATPAPSGQPTASLAPAESARVSAWFAKNRATPPHAVDHAIVVIIDEIEAKPELASAVRKLLQQGAGRDHALDSVALRDLVERARVDVERARLGLGAFSPEHGRSRHQVEAFDDAAIPACIVEHGLVLSGRETRFEVALDWSAYRGTHDAAFSERDWHVTVDWVFERMDVQGPSPRDGAPVMPPEHVRSGTTQEHAFKLGPREQSGTWTVHAFIYTSHFAPRHITAPIVVKTENARMADLRGEAFAGMEPANAKTSPHHIGLGMRNTLAAGVHLNGHDPDAEGSVTTGELPASFHARTAQERASDRQAELARAAQLVDYLQQLADPRYAAALGAAKRRLAELRSVDKDIQSDEAKGWQSFELRGTFLCRRPEVPSGPLDLYGTVHREPIGMPPGPGAAMYGLAGKAPSLVTVQIRDHSQRIGPDTLRLTGKGATFEEALENAVVDLAKEYPEGKVSVLAQEMDASGSTAAPTRKAIGFELPTTSSWKRLKDKIYNPTVQTIVNVAATALMIFQPELAPVLMSILTVQNTVRNIDELVHLRDTGQLTDLREFGTLAQIGLDVLPFVRGAKILSSPARLVAFEAVNHAGMLIVMGLQTRDAIAQIQDNDIAALAEKYRELLDFQANKNASDPALDPQLQQQIAAKKREIDQGAEQIRNRVQEQWTAALGQNGIFMVGSHILGDIQRTRVSGQMGFDEGAEDPSTGHEDPATNGAHAGEGQDGTQGGGTDHRSTGGERRPAAHAGATPEGTATENTSHHGDEPPKPPKPPDEHAGGGSGAGGPRPKRRSSIASERSAGAAEQALIDAAVARRRAAHSAPSDSGGEPAAATHSTVERETPKPVAGEHVANDFRTEQEADYTRWQNKGLEQDPRGRQSLEDPEFRRWYDRWMSIPENVVADASGKLHIKLPRGVPEPIAAQLRAVAEQGNIGIMARAEFVRQRISKELPGKALDPSAKDWPETRAKLVEIVGEQAVRKLEAEKTERVGQLKDDKASIDSWLDKEVWRGEFKSLQQMYPGAEIYVTGSGAQPVKATEGLAKGKKLDDIDLIVVVPDSTPPNVRAEMEARLSKTKLNRPADPDRPIATARELPVDGKVMTQSEFAGYSMMKTADGRTELSNVRIDAAQAKETPGTGTSGVDLHNHIMGVPATEYYVNKIGGGSAVDVLEKAWILVQKHGDEIQATTRSAIARAIADVQSAEQAGLPRGALEARARRGLDQALAAHPEEMPFDHTYDLRDALIREYVDPTSATNPQGTFENFATDVLTTLHDQGVSSSEQSVSIKKLNQRFDPETMARAHARAKAEGKDSELSFLAMLPSDKVLSAKPGNSNLPKELAAQLTNVLERGDVKGVDFAGPEAQAFTTPEGMAQFKQVYDLLSKAARQRGEPLVLRPHVGEGYAPQGGRAHVEVAQQNIEMLLHTLDDLGYKAGGPIVVRLGHATHATDAQLAHMQRLGIIVEANVGSNLATGSIVSLDQHPLLRNIYYGVSTVLATDAQGVMSTTLPDEYRRAAEMIERFRRGEFAIQIGSEKKSFSDLTAEQQERFSVVWLERQVAAYGDASRAKPRPTDDVTPTDPSSKEHR